MHDRPAWAARERRSADRMGSVLLLLGAGLLAAGVVVVGWSPMVGPVPEIVVFVLMLVASAVTWRFAGRLPWAVYPSTMFGVVVAVAGLVGLDPTFQLIGVPLFFLVVVYVSHWFGRSFARATTVLAVLGELWVFVQPDQPTVVVLTVVYMVGVTVLVHVLLTRSADRQQELVAALTHDSRHDGMTGVLNRRAFDAELHRACGAPEPGTTLMLVDLDGLKQLNDRYGHQTGDAAIRHVAAVVGATVRGQDAVVGRLGGDELAVPLRRCPAPVAARRAADVVAAVAATPLRLPGDEELTVGISVGVVTATEDGPDDLYAAADAALYAAKSGGRGRAEVHPAG